MTAPNDILTPTERRFLASARRAVLATTAPDDRPRLVPVCFVLGQDDSLGRPRLYTPLDQKPKKVDDPHRLARVQDLLVLPQVTLLVDRWDEDWSRLAWLRIHGTGELLEPEPHERQEHVAAVAALREKYPPYQEMNLESSPIIRITITRGLSWGDLDQPNEQVSADLPSAKSAAPA